MEIFTAKDICKKFNLPYWRLEYLFRSGNISEVNRTTSNNRIFFKSDVKEIKDYLENKNVNHIRKKQSKFKEG
jgi:hypothetical protein